MAGEARRFLSVAIRVPQCFSAMHHVLPNHRGTSRPGPKGQRQDKEQPQQKTHSGHHGRGPAVVTLE